MYGWIITGTLFWLFGEYNWRTRRRRVAVLCYVLSIVCVAVYAVRSEQ